jgi:hypothetical protein
MTIKLIAPAGQGGIIMGASGVQYTIGSDGSVSVNSADVLPLLRSGYSLFGTNSGKVSLNSPLPADLISVKAAAAPVNGAITIAAQPAHARKLQVRIVDGGTHITAGTLTLVGTDQDGNAITETLSLITAVDVTLKTKWAYAHLTSGTVAGLVGGGSSTLGIGLSNDFGVQTCASPSTPVGLVCTKATKITKVLGTSNVAADDVASTTTVDATARTIAPTTAPAASGLVDYEFTYAFSAAA